MSDVEKCLSCHYWRGANGCNSSESLRLCHHLLDTGKRRKVDENTGECLSRTPRQKRKNGEDEPGFFTSP